MSGLFVILGILSVLVAALLIFVVVIQNSKGGGLSSTFGASSATQMLGARRSNEAIEKITWYLAGGLALVAFLANVAGSSSTGSNQGSMMQQSIENQIIQDPTSIPDLSTPAESSDPAAAGEEGGN
ncbi:MAG: preprotein translocase subunit SecG [Bacteroidetes bacterium]|nr:MAG: preprotein translocase subunit SecG [Bacteroidota bacterium]